MSAWICSYYHINYILSYYKDACNEDVIWMGGSKLTLEVAGDKLRNENYRSVNYRYSTNDKPRKDFKYEHIKDTKALQAFQNCACLGYQSNETTDYETTEAYALLKTIESDIAHSIISKMKGWKGVKWGMDETFKD